MTGLKVGTAPTPRTPAQTGQILRLYQDKGYDLAEVNLLEGGNPGDTKVVIQISRGPRSRSAASLRRQRVCRDAPVADPDLHPEADPGALRQVSPRHAR